MRKRSISSLSLLFASVSAILGSGWLFAAYYTSILAGPAALLSWVIGAIVLIIVAFTFAELSAMIPVMGSSSRIPQFTHGSVVSFLFAWIIWLSYASLAPTEVQAVLQYLSYFFPSLTFAQGGLTKIGLLWAAILMIGISAINIFSLRWLLKANSFLTLLKILIPIIISVSIIFIFYHSTQTQNYNIFTPFMPMGMHSLFTAIAAGGIVFAFNGFKQACEMAGEAKKPKKSLPIAIIGSIAVCALLYLLLQIAFIASVYRHNVSADGHFHNWATLQLVGTNSPFASALSSEHLPVLTAILYVGAMVGPLGAALMYMCSASRSLYAMSKNEYLPLFFQKLTTDGNPVYGIVVNFFLGMFLFLPLPGWDKMVTFLTSLMAITYSIAPVCLLALRDQAPDQLRPFKLPFAKLWVFFAFYICTLLTYWSGWNIISKLGFSFIISLIVLLCYHFFTERGRKIVLNWRAAIWVWPYFIGITLISYLGNFGKTALQIIPFGMDFIIIAIFCLFILWLAQRYKLPAEETQKYIKDLKLFHAHGERGHE